MNDNLSFMKDFTPLSEDEYEVIRKAQDIMGSLNTVPCTTCDYCKEGCPRKIPISGIFSAMNKRIGSGLIDEAKDHYKKLVEENMASASDCIACGKCEEACPQHINVIERLREGAKMFNEDK